MGGPIGLKSAVHKEWLLFYLAQPNLLPIYLRTLLFSPDLNPPPSLPFSIFPSPAPAAAF